MIKKQKILLILPFIIFIKMSGIFQGLSFIFKKAIFFEREIISSI